MSYLLWNHLLDTARLYQTESHDKEFVLAPGGLPIMAYRGRVLRNGYFL